MARKVTKSKARPAPKGAGSVNGPGDIDAMHPHRRAVVAGRHLLMREYSHVEGMEVEQICRPFFDDLYALVPPGGGAPAFAEIAGAIRRNFPAVRWLMARAISPPPPFPGDDEQAYAGQVEEAERWVHGLDDVAGAQLRALWWMVNVGFFTRRLLEAAEIKAAASRSAGRASTRPSPGPDTDADPTTSADSPAGS